MSADVLAVLRAHLPKDRYDDDGAHLKVVCSCGQWEGDYFADGEAGPFDDHLAEQLAPLLAEVADRARREGWDEALRWAEQLAIGCEHSDTLAWCDICEEWHAAIRARADRGGEEVGGA